jgi:hypothetical protein
MIENNLGLIRERKLAPKAKRRPPMRILFGIPIAVVIAIGVWWTFPTQAKQQYHSISMDPVGMMATTSDLPVDPECDQGTVFLPAGAHYS